MKPKISVIVPAYNEEKNIVKCLDCLLNQNYPKDKYEVIVIDDGSQDDTVGKVEEYFKKQDMGPCFLIKHGKNRGTPESLNTGINHAQGEIIWKLDADCEVDENCLQIIDSAFQKNQSKNSFSALVYTKKKKHIAPAIRTFISGDPKLGMISFRKKWFSEKIGKFTSIKGTMGGTRITGIKMQRIDGVNPLRELKVHEKSPESIIWLIKRLYHGGIVSLGLERALGLSMLPSATLVIALSILIHPLFLLPFSLYFFQALRFYQKFQRKLWFGQFLLVKPLTHVSYSLGTWRSVFSC